MSKYVYVCGVDWQHEIGEANDIIVYASLDYLKKHHTCWKECGIVKLKVDLEEWIEPQDLFKEIE